MARTTTTPPDETTDPPEQAPGSTGTTPPAAGNRFFEWMRDIDIPRQPGWIGGVCAGIAARLGIDPAIVRGIVVVIAVLGGPVAILYAAAWLLLPDASNKIHLEELTRGRIEPPLAGIAALALASLLPLTQGFWWIGAAYWGEPDVWVPIGRLLWTSALLAVLVAFVVWIARRSGTGASEATPTVVPATTDDRPDTIPAPATDASSDAEASVPTTLPMTEIEPAPPGAGATPDQWDDWKRERAQWRAHRQASDKELRDRRAAEQRVRARERAAADAERQRLHRLANPRAGAAFSSIALGAAILAGAVGTFVAAGTEFAGYEVTVALAIGTIFIATAVAVAGLMRRRAGFLAFVATLAVLATVLSAAVPRDRELVPSFSSYGVAEPGEYFALAGNVYITVGPGSAPAGGVIDVWQMWGTTDVQILEGASARIEVVSHSGQVYSRTISDSDLSGGLVEQTTVNGEWRSSIQVGDGDEPGVTVRIWQQQPGVITILDLNPTLETTP